MIAILTFSSTDKKDIILPFNYEEYIQALLYKIIDNKKFSDFLHNTGYKLQNRSYKMFAFSKILEKPVINKEEKFFYFQKNITIAISSIKNEFLNSIFQSILINKDMLFLGSNNVTISNIKSVHINPSENELVRTLSPICCYSTATLADGRKRTIYYHPKDKDFLISVKNNLMHKYEALYGSKLNDPHFSVEPEVNIKEKVINYKGTIIKSYSGTFKLKGSIELMQIAFEAGLGAKNSQGFGLIVPKHIKF